MWPFLTRRGAARPRADRASKHALGRLPPLYRPIHLTQHAISIVDGREVRVQACNESAAVSATFLCALQQRAALGGAQPDAQRSQGRPLAPKREHPAVDLALEPRVESASTRSLRGDNAGDEQRRGDRAEHKREGGMERVVVGGAARAPD